MSYSLDISDLSFAFEGQKPLWQNLTFSAHAGDVWHILGENGAGKSTFLGVLAGLRRPKSGQIILRTPANAVLQDRESIRPFVDYLAPGANGHYETLPAEKNIQFWSHLRGVTCTATQLDDVFSLWGLSAVRGASKFPVAYFSTGMKRRLAFVRMCLWDAPVWLLDEPLYGLDRSGVSKVMDSIKRRAERGLITIFISHEPMDGLVVRSFSLGKL